VSWDDALSPSLRPRQGHGEHFIIRQTVKPHFWQKFSFIFLFFFFFSSDHSRFYLTFIYSADWENRFTFAVFVAAGAKKPSSKSSVILPVIPNGKNSRLKTSDRCLSFNQVLLLQWQQELGDGIKMSNN
jgi:hypothetical protein